jgi:hypothetical protein
MHLDGGHHARWDALLLERILESKSIDHSCQHPHVVASDPVHVFRGRSHAAKEVPAANHQSDLDACAGDFRNLACQTLYPNRIETEGVGSGQGFATDLEKNSLIFSHSRFF